RVVCDRLAFWPPGRGYAPAQLGELRLREADLERADGVVFGGHVLLLVAGDVDDGLGERLRGFLRQVVPDAARDGAVFVFARELCLVGGGLGVRCAVGVTFEGDRRNGDDRARGELAFEIVILFFAVGQAVPPAVV